MRERSVLRKLIAASDSIASAAFNPEGNTIATILDAAEQQIFAIGQTANSTTTDDWESADTGVARLLDRIQRQANGSAEQDFTPTGIADLDTRLDGGMRAGELIIIGARPSMGKSALALSIAMNVALRERLPVGVFSMEMPRMQVHNRALSILSGIHLSRIKRAERLHDYDWPRITSSVEQMRGLRLDVNDQAGLNINQVRSKARALHRRYGRLGLIVVDYLQLMSGTDQRVSRTYQLEEVSRGLKALGKELQCPVMALAQVNRGVEKEVDPMPRLSDLKDCGAIEQDADIVLFVHRPIKANPLLDDEWKYYARGSVAKVRDGEPGFLDMRYVGENTHFIDWPADQPVPTNKAVSSRGREL